MSKACRIMGYSRQQFYEIRRNYQTYGPDGLIDHLLGARKLTGYYRYNRLDPLHNICCLSALRRPI